MQNINIQDEEKYGYSDIVDEMQVTKVAPVPFL
jgi:hypothetical protein